VVNATDTGGVFYYFSDHLKTASVITDSAGVIKAESDYYPWGGELQFVNNDTNDYKFTGKKRDSETGLDYFGARYYSNGLGRWVSADWSATPVPVPYADFGDPQSLNLYGFVGGNPASKADPDGHCCSLSEVVDFVGGVSQGIVASASFGAVGAPKSSDSNASLWGQAVGTIIEGSMGTVLRNTGAGAVGVGLVAEAPSAGTSTAVVVTGAVGVVAGGAMETGAVKNVGAIAHAMSNRAGDFSTSDKKQLDQQNANQNGGQNKCTECGQDVQQVQNKKGETPPANQLQRHHDPQLSKGGNSKSPKNRIVCRACHPKVDKELREQQKKQQK
jgi:RHS repeat-associated protein